MLMIGNFHSADGSRRVAKMVAPNLQLFLRSATKKGKTGIRSCLSCTFGPLAWRLLAHNLHVHFPAPRAVELAEVDALPGTQHKPASIGDNSDA